MECRICLGADHPETMLRPCRCRGSSAYIHEPCLRTYLQYYPDRICRVCHERMEHPWVDIEQNIICAIVVSVWSFILLELSTMPLPFKLLCLGSLLGLIVFHARKRQLSYGIVTICILTSGLLVIAEPNVILQTVVLVYALLLIAALCFFLSVDTVFLVLLLGFATMYSVLLTLAVAARSDPAFTSLFLLAMTTLWLALVRPATA